MKKEMLEDLKKIKKEDFYLCKKYSLAYEYNKAMIYEGEYIRYIVWLDETNSSYNEMELLNKKELKVVVRSYFYNDRVVFKNESQKIAKMACPFSYVPANFTYKTVKKGPYYELFNVNCSGFRENIYGFDSKMISAYNYDKINVFDKKNNYFDFYSCDRFIRILSLPRVDINYLQDLIYFDNKRNKICRTFVEPEGDDLHIEIYLFKNSNEFSKAEKKFRSLENPFLYIPTNADRRIIVQNTIYPLYI